MFYCSTGCSTTPLRCEQAFLSRQNVRQRLLGWLPSQSNVFSCSTRCPTTLLRCRQAFLSTPGYSPTLACLIRWVWLGSVPVGGSTSYISRLCTGGKRGARLAGASLGRRLERRCIFFPCSWRPYRVHSPRTSSVQRVRTFVPVTSSPESLGTARLGGVVP